MDIDIFNRFSNLIISICVLITCIRSLTMFAWICILYTWYDKWYVLISEIICIYSIKIFSLHGNTISWISLILLTIYQCEYTSVYFKLCCATQFQINCNELTLMTGRWMDATRLESKYNNIFYKNLNYLILRQTK